MELLQGERPKPFHRDREMTQQKAPLVSVVIPAYNGAPVIGEAIESVLAQSFNDFELIVVDDGSTDNTSQVVRAFEPRIRYIHQTNGGLCAARNRGIAGAQGEWISFLDQDDLWLPEKLAVQVRDMSTHSDLVLHVTNAYISRPQTGQEALLFAHSGVEDQLATGLSILDRPLVPHVKYGLGWAQCVLARKGIIREAGLYDESYRLWMDIDLWARVALRGRWGVNSQPLVRILRRAELPDNMSSLRTRDPVLASSEMVDCLGKLVAETGLNSTEKSWLRGRLAEARAGLAYELLRRGETPVARRQLRSALRDRFCVKSCLKYAASFVPFGFGLELGKAARRIKERAIR